VTTKRQRIQQDVRQLAAPIVEELGLEFVDVEFTRHGRDQVLTLFLDRAEGIAVDELQQASRAVEKALEIEEIITGPYRLEVSSPGIDRSLKNLSDYRKNVGTRVRIKTFSPLPVFGRMLTGTIAGVEGQKVTVETHDGSRVCVPLSEISSARPEIDWEEILRKPAPPRGKQSHARKSP
jgi:ribosome maturation factor RimP